ncbi:MAG: hypothetical protein JW940_02370 [Polyangiaceae bacterium]|nr:hypothetical protein [Polyangiaceae bacterium]
MNTNQHLSRALVALAFALPALGACGSDFAPGSRITGLRVLAVQADEPYARPGETVHLRALGVDTRERPIVWAWAACLLPDATSVDGCLDELATSGRPTSEAVFASGEGVTEVDYTVPADALEGLSPQARSQAVAGILSMACPGKLDLHRDANGIPFRCIDPESGRALDLDKTVVGLKRIMLRESERNDNPVIDAILLDGDEWLEDDVKEVDSCNTSDDDYDGCPSAPKHTLSVRIPRGSIESGQDEFGREYTEQVVVQYYTTEGIFEDQVRTSSDTTTGWVARRRASGDEVSLWFVVRDDRGGVSWAERRVEVK